MKNCFIVLVVLLMFGCGISKNHNFNYTDTIPISPENPFPEDPPDCSYEGNGWYWGDNWIESQYFINNDISLD